MCDGKATFALYDPRSGKWGPRFGAATDAVYCAALSPDGQTLAVGGQSPTVRLWNVRTGAERLNFDRHPNSVAALAFTRDGKTLFTGGGPMTGSRDDQIRIWDTATGKQIGGVPVLLGYVDRLACSPDGRTLALNGSTEPNHRLELTFRLIDRATGKDLWNQPAKARFDLFATAIAFSPDGRTVAFANSHRGVCLLDTATGREMRRLDFSSTFGELRLPGGVTSLVFSPDGKSLTASGATGGIDSSQGSIPLRKHLRRWEVATGSEMHHVQAARVAGILSPDGLTVVERLYPGKVTIGDAVTGWPLFTTDVHPYQGHVTAYSPDGSLLAVGGDLVHPADSAVRVVEVVTGKEVRRFTGHAGPVGSLAFSPDGRSLASGSDDTTALLWDLVPPLRPGENPEVLWEALGGDAAAAYQARWALAAAGPKAVAWMREQLKPASTPPAEVRIRKLIAGLDSEKFAEREAAFRSLKEAGAAAKLIYVELLQTKLTLEARRRLEILSDALKVAPLGRPSAESVRRIRAVQVLGQIGTPAARALLEDLAGGAGTARETLYARAALERLKAAGR
jgi:WD40 repeat protein